MTRVVPTQALFRTCIATLIRLAPATVLALSAGPVLAQAYPTHPAKIIAPFAPGGALDMIARGVAQELTAQTGQTYMVDNKAGAAGMIGSAAVARSEPDGYTLLLGSTTTHGINPVLYKAPLYAPKDFAPVSLIATIPHVLIVNPELPVNNLQEFLAYAKSHKGMTFGSAGIGSPHHLAGELLKTSANLDLVHVPYKGSAPALAALMGNQIGFLSVEYTAAAAAIQGGRVKPIALASAERVPGIDVQTYKEQGMPFEVTAWYAIYAPANTPTAIVNQLSQGIAKGLKEPAFRDRLIALGAVPIGSTPEEMAAFERKELVLWAKAVKESGATAQ